MGADAGLELTTFITGASAQTLAAALAPYADQPVPVSQELEELWFAHGLRLIAVPVEDAPGIIAALQTGGSQRQWLGQAYAWTEAARGPEMDAGRIIALDAERIRLQAGALRLLVRSWVEPAPSEPRVGAVNTGGASPEAPDAVLRVELLPQLREHHPAASADNPLVVSEPSIEAESRGLLFSRLYARLRVPPGRALFIVAERPGADWNRLARQPDPMTERIREVRESQRAEQEAARVAANAAALSDNPWQGRAPAARPAKPTPPSDEWAKVRVHSEPPAPDATAAAAETAPAPAPKRSEPPPSSGAPRLGEVVRGPIRAPSLSPDAATSGTDPGAAESGPATLRVPTLGEAMLNQPPSDDDARSRPRSVASTQRTVLVLTPRLPRQWRLLGAAPPAP